MRIFLGKYLFSRIFIKNSFKLKKVNWIITVYLTPKAQLFYPFKHWISVLVWRIRGWRHSLEAGLLEDVRHGNPLKNIMYINQNVKKLNRVCKISCGQWSFPCLYEYFIPASNHSKSNLISHLTLLPQWCEIALKSKKALKYGCTEISRLEL